MTSNLGGDLIREAGENKKGQSASKQDLQKKIWELLHVHFKPEFLNRLDGVVTFNPLSAKDILEISKQQLEQVRRRMGDNNIELKISDELALYFAEIGYDPIFGARPLRRAIEEKLVDEIAMRIIEGNIKPGDMLEPKVRGDKIAI
jgi:ATP-dependent Clp protease ATP-binding subunit ClpB